MKRWSVLSVVALVCGLVCGLVLGSSVEAGRRTRYSPVQTLCCSPQPSAISCQPAAGVCEVAASSRVTEVTRVKSVDCEGNTCRQRTVTTSTSHASSSGGVAQWKAEQLAQRGQLVHLGGSFGGGSHEGIGYGATAQQATQSCCFWGQRTPIEIGTAQSASGGWYAVVLYR